MDHQGLQYLDGYLWGTEYGESWMQLLKNTESTFVRYSTPSVKRATRASMKMLFCKLGERRARR